MAVVKHKNIDARPSGEYRVRVKGFPSKTFPVLADALAHRDKLQRARSTGTMDDPDADLITVRALGDEWAQANQVEERTRAVYRSLWKHVLTAHLADMPIRMVTTATVEDWRDDLLAAGVGVESVRKTMALLQTVMDRGERYGKRNPCKAAKKPRQARKGTVTVLSPAQVERIRAQVKGTDAVLIALLAYSGMRPGEARALTWGDVKQRTIVVDKAVQPDGTVKATKTSRNRSARLVKPLADDLKAFRVASGNPKDAALIFPRADGRAWTDSDWRNWSKRRFAKAADAAGVTIGRPYDLRHSAASLWLHEGTNAVQVAAWMGHSLQELSKTYAHVISDLDPEDRRSAVDMIQDARHDTAQDNARTTLVVLEGQRQSGRRAKATATA